MVGFKVGQKVVYPNHGIGTIEQIEQKQIGTNSLPFYTLRLAATNSLVLVPYVMVVRPNRTLIPLGHDDDRVRGQFLVGKVWRCNRVRIRGPKARKAEERSK